MEEVPCTFSASFSRHFSIVSFSSFTGLAVASTPTLSSPTPFSFSRHFSIVSFSSFTGLAVASTPTLSSTTPFSFSRHCGCDCGSCCC
jgi:hypothetical protein